MHGCMPTCSVNIPKTECYVGGSHIWSLSNSRLIWLNGFKQRVKSQVFTTFFWWFSAVIRCGHKSRVHTMLKRNLAHLQEPMDWWMDGMRTKRSSSDIIRSLARLIGEEQKRGIWFESLCTSKVVGKIPRIECSYGNEFFNCSEYA